MLILISASKVDNRDNFSVFDGEECVAKPPTGRRLQFTEQARLGIALLFELLRDVAELGIERAAYPAKHRAPRPKWLGLLTLTRPTRYVPDLCAPSYFQNVNQFKRALAPPSENVTMLLSLSKPRFAFHATSFFIIALASISARRRANVASASLARFTAAIALCSAVIALCSAAASL